MNKVKTMQELYEETKDYDLVIANDAPLNRGLNRKVDKPVLGSFALTPKFIGGKYSNYLFEEELLQLPQLVIKIKEEFGLSLKEALFYTNNVIRVWEQTGSLCEVKKYVSSKERQILDFLEKQPTYYFAMESMSLDFFDVLGKLSSVAVIGEELFNGLDRKVLVDELSKVNVSPFKEKGVVHKLEPIYLFDSQKDVVDRLVQMITKENQDSVAVVLNVESEYLPLIKARLINNRVELNEKLFLASDFRVREYLAVIESSIFMHNVKTRDLIPIANIFNVELDVSKEDALFRELVKVDSSAKEVFTKLNEIRRKTYLELVSDLKKYGLIVPDEFVDILKTLKLDCEKISRKTFLELKYFIENFEQEFERNRSGVLLVNAKNSTYINRDVIFYVGMDHTWTKVVDNVSYLDLDLEMQKNVKRFEILVQQGQERFFFVPLYTNSEKTIPPYYFNFIANRQVESYEDDYFETVAVVNEIGEGSIEIGVQRLETGDGSVRETFSSSSLSKFVSCPKAYSYSRLVSGVDRDFFLRGNLIHEFAEFYINEKDFVVEKGVDEFVNIMSSKMKLLSNPYQNDVVSNQMRFAIVSLMDFLDLQVIDDSLSFDSFKEISKKNQENIFAKHFGREVKKINAELEFKDTDLKLNGFIDLAVNSSLIVDYKTARAKKSVKSIVRKANFKEPSSDCDFQPLVYLSVFRKVSPDKEIQFWYNFPMINTYLRVVGKELDDTNVKVHYVPQRFVDYFATREFFDVFLEDAPKYAKSVLGVVDDFSYFDGKEISDEMLENSNKFAERYCDEYCEYLFSLGLKDTKTNVASVFKVLKSVFDFRLGMRSKQQEVYFFKETLDEFEVFVKEKLDELNECYKTRFLCKPVEGNDTCKNCDFKVMCLKKLDLENGE